LHASRKASAQALLGWDPVDVHLYLLKNWYYDSVSDSIFVQVELAMSDRTKKFHPALKHGAYSVTGLLPGEDRTAFEKLRRDLISELRPEGPLESEIVETIVRLFWRKQNLETLRIAESARKRNATIWSRVPSTSAPLITYDLALDPDPDWEPTDPAEVEAARKAALAQAQEELGDRYVFVEMGEAVTLEQTFKDFEVEARFDAMIEKLLKQLLFLRGLKSLQAAGSSAPLPRIPGPRKAA
jgi:hypothetical protein